MAAFWFNLVGLSVGLFGSIVLAVSLSRLTLELRFAIELHDVTIGQLVNGGDVPVFTGIDERLRAGFQSATSSTIRGVILVAAGFALQGVALLLT